MPPLLLAICCAVGTTEIFVLKFCSFPEVVAARMLTALATVATVWCALARCIVE
jgi:hypothetical protein